MTPELLAPAGGLEALQAAVCAGADAVYLGAASFGARAAVGFTPDELKQAIRFAHFHRRRIYVTVNTLIKDNEWADLRRLLTMLRDLRADAVLVQDLGVARLCREEFPELTLHASTQMSLHTPSGIRWARQNGFKRVVLNREACLEDIRAAAATGVEIEVFAHGALCVSVSGQCALSASLGERSGNRGRCAQPCRLPYSYRGAERAWLSPADLCALSILPQLSEAGVASLKLEGRLKRPEYVYVVTDVYRRALDSLDRKQTTVSQDDEEALRQIFCRGRFTIGYAGGCQDAGILNPAHTAHEGVRIGSVTKSIRRGAAVLATFAPEKTLLDQDGLTVGDDKCIYTGPRVEAGQTATLRLHRMAPAGTAVFRTESSRQLADARQGYSSEALRRLRLPVKAELCAYVGSPARLTLSASGASVRIEGPVCERAAQRPLSEATVRQALSKTGDAPFLLSDLEVKCADAYLSSAQLNAMRREGLAALEDAVILRHESATRQTLPDMPQADEPPAHPRHGRFFVGTDRAEEVIPLLEAGADHVFFSPSDTTEDGLRALSTQELPAGSVSLLLPPQADDLTTARLAERAEHMGLTMAAGNVGQLLPVASATDDGKAASALNKEISEIFRCRSNNNAVRFACEGVPVFNAETERFLRRQGIEGAVLSAELSGREIAAMPAPTLERILCVYGRQRLMLLNHCPERVYRGLETGHESCRLCESGRGLKGQCLTDRKGMRLPLIPYRTDRGCVVRLYSAKPVSLHSRMDELRRLPLSFLLTFTDEPYETRLRILKAFVTGSALNVDATPGKYLTGVQ